MTADNHLHGFSPRLERKLKKPLMEKRRRARINKSLIELKSVLLHAPAGTPQGAKLEKADILEMTVNYVRSVKGGKAANSLTNSRHQFADGFTACAQSVAQFFGTQQTLALMGCSPTAVSQVTNQLMTHLQRALTLRLEQYAPVISAANPPTNGASVCGSDKLAAPTTSHPLYGPYHDAHTVPVSHSSPPKNTCAARSIRVPTAVKAQVGTIACQKGMVPQHRPPPHHGSPPLMPIGFKPLQSQLSLDINCSSSGHGTAPHYGFTSVSHCAPTPPFRFEQQLIMSSSPLSSGFSDRSTSCCGDDSSLSPLSSTGDDGHVHDGPHTPMTPQRLRLVENHEEKVWRPW